MTHSVEYLRSVVFSVFPELFRERIVSFFSSFYFFLITTRKSSELS